jgi:hypothetical protein
MKNSFLRQLDNLSENITAEDTDYSAIYAAVHNQTDGFDRVPKSKRGFRFYIVLSSLITAIILGGTAAAYYLTRASDVFGDALDIPADSPAARIVDRSGAVVEETVVVDGIEVAVRGVVGAGSELKILIDIEDLSGNPLALTNSDGTLSENPLWFGKTKLRSDETRDYVCYFDETPGFWRGGHNADVALTIPDINADGWLPLPQHEMRTDIIKSETPDKATILMSISLDGESIQDYMGESLYLSITDLVQYVMVDGIDLQSDLYSIVNQFNNVTESDFRRTGGSTQDFVNWVWNYELITDSAVQIPLTALNDDYTVTNAAITNGVLYLRGEIKDFTDEQVPYFTLLNTVTGEYLRAPSNAGGNGEEDAVARWSCSFKGIDSLDQLKDYALILGRGLQTQTIAQGQWDFEIPISFENLSKTHNIGRAFTLGGFELTANSITVSPYYISMNISVDEDNLAKINHIQDPISLDWSPIVSGLTDWDRFIMDEQPTVTIIMKDTSEVAVEIGMFTALYNLDDNILNLTPGIVINPEQIQIIRIGDLEFFMN